MNIRTRVKFKAVAILEVCYCSEAVSYWRVLEETEGSDPAFRDLAWSTLKGALNAVIRETGRSRKGDDILPP